jgi:hypothetical protein
MRATKQVVDGRPRQAPAALPRFATAGDNPGVRDEPVRAGHEPLLVPVMLDGQPTGANGDLGDQALREAGQL